MCGIYGIINLGYYQQPVKHFQETVETGIHLLEHRGPDDIGVETFDTGCIGHARLSIIDLEGGHQPMYNHNRRGLISYNGEVYNFVELRQELEKLGHVFDTRSDTEVVLNAYLEWGTDCVKRFNGMFAFTAIDFEKGKVLIARDRLGIKPLFYTIRDRLLTFSSELEPIYKTISPLKIDIGALDDYLAWQYIPAPRTIYKDVFSLPPAHLIEIDLISGDINIERYWELEFKEDFSLTMDEWQHCVEEQIRMAVDRRLVSDVPFGAFLSGGIDSSLVTGYMADIMEQPVKTFSIGFNESNYSELDYAKQVADINNTEHHTEIVEAESLKLLPKLVQHYGQPFADSSAIPTYYVSQMARKDVKMVLSGDGGDENFAGYNSYPAILKNSKNVEEAFGFHCLNYKHFLPRERYILFKEEYRHIVRDIAVERGALMYVQNQYQPLLSRLQHLDLMTYLPFDILTKVDIASMANSLEVRVPLLDHNVVEMAARIPAKYKLTEDYEKKYILKQVAKQRYPASIIDRPKMGFGIPLGIWFATKLRNDVQRKLLLSKYLPIYFNMQYIAQMLNAHNQINDHSARIWNLLFLEEWMSSHSNVI